MKNTFEISSVQLFLTVLNNTITSFDRMINMARRNSGFIVLLDINKQKTELKWIENTTKSVSQKNCFFIYIVIFSPEQIVGEFIYFPFSLF